ncbi:MAG: TetR/AcrR family transcriptional regulator [Rhodobacteraceae bacterium]|nr:TetR/AcrR family transcriptional regulator [Paracoccaceae bacterium]
MARTVARDHAQKRQAILKTAARFFAENGYDRSSMNQLSEACGISKALIYHYYNGKEALLFDIVKNHLESLLGVMQAVDRSGPDAEENLRTLIHAILDAYRDADAEHQVQNAAMTVLPASERSYLANLQQQMVAIAADTLASVTPGLYETSPKRLRPVTMSMFGMLNWFYMWHRKGKGISRQEYADLVADLMLKGVRGL